MIWLPDEAATQQLAHDVAGLLKAPFVLTLGGEIGAGKTTFVRALLRAFNVKEAIKSPTFSLVETYVLPETDQVFHHFDLYRIADIQELEYIGFRDYFTDNEICCIEWPERAQSEIGAIDLHLSLQWKEAGREATFVFHSSKGQKLMEQL
jgi:tRNA threonylcarbamoyladenosine biosynthesis protein TsaE